MSKAKPIDTCECLCPECFMGLHNRCSRGLCRHSHPSQAAQQKPTGQQGPELSGCASAVSAPNDAEFTKAFRDKPPVAPELKDIVESAKLNERDKDQIRSAWHLICDSGKYMLDLIRTDIEKTYSGDFDRMHRMRHSLRDLFSIVCVLNKRGNSIYSPAALNDLADYDYTATINAIAAACRVNEAGQKEISAAMFWKVYREEKKS